MAESWNHRREGRSTAGPHPPLPIFISRLFQILLFVSAVRPTRRRQQAPRLGRQRAHGAHSFDNAQVRHPTRTYLRSPTPKPAITS